MTQRELPFLEVMGKQSNKTSIKLHVVPRAVTAPWNSFGDLFSVPVGITHVNHMSDYRVRAANIIANRVATDTRRGVANILFVPDTETEMYYQNSFVMQAWCKKIVVVPDMAPNELGVTYWQLNLNPDRKPIAVDGALQFFEDGFSHFEMPKLREYFQHCFL